MPDPKCRAPYHNVRGMIWSDTKGKPLALHERGFHEKANEIKRMMNSVYGAMGSKYFRYCEFENAESITAFGRLTNRWNINAVNAFLNGLTENEGKDFVITADTDSNYYDLSDVAELIVHDNATDNERADILNVFHKEVLGPEIDRSTQVMSDYMNVYENTMVWEREAIAKVAIWVAKKNYTMLVLDNEGTRYEHPKHKTVGLETVKSSTAQWAKESLTEFYTICLTKSETDAQEFIANVYHKMVQLPVDDLAKFQSANGFSKYADDETLYKKGTPNQVKAALIFNKMIRDQRLDVPEIQSGVKVKLLPLRTPNPANNDTIAFEGRLPKQLGLHRFIDMEKIFESQFVKPATRILDSLEWEREPTVSLESLFM